MVSLHFYLKLARNAKKIGAICIAPMLVSESGVFNGKTVTGWEQGGMQRGFVEANGGFWSDDSVVVCGNIVTWNWPDAAEEFAKKGVELIDSITVGDIIDEKAKMVRMSKCTIISCNYYSISFLRFKTKYFL